MNRLKLHKKGGRERIEEWKGDSIRLELDGDGKQKRRSVTIYVDSIRHSAAGRLAALEAARFNRPGERGLTHSEKELYETELDEGPITLAHGSPVHLGPGEFEMRPDTFNKHRLDIRGLSHVES